MKRKLMALILSSSMLVGAAPAALAAEAVSTEPTQEVQTGTVALSGYCGAEQGGQNLAWAVQDGVLTISGTGRMADYDTEKPAPWKDAAASISAVVIQEGVTSIDDSAFNGLINAKSVTIPSTVTAIDYFAFSECAGDITVAAENTAYASADGVLFNKGMTELIACPSGNARTSYEIPVTVTDIADGAFYHCANIASVTLPAGLKTIGKYAFSGTGLTGITVPNGVTEIRTGAFYGCTALTSAVLPEGLTSLDSGLFSGCEKLTAVPIPSTVTTIGDTVFYGCKSLSAIAIPDGVTGIEYQAFEGCTALTSVTIPAAIERIGSSVFSGCTALTEVKFRGNAPEIGENAFANVIAKAYYPQGNRAWSSDKLKSYGGQLTWEKWNSDTQHTHTVVNVKAEKATPSKNGKTEGSYCSVCGETIVKQTTIYKASNIKLSRTSYNYDGTKKTPSVTVRDSKGNRIAKSNYTVKYDSGRKAEGKYKVVVQFKGDKYKGKKTLTFEIKHVHKVVKDPLVKATPDKDGKTAGTHCSTCKKVLTKQEIIYKVSNVKLSRKTYKYNGKQKTPKVSVHDSKGNIIAKSNYNVTYSSGRTEIGTYNVTVTFKGEKYSGSKTLSFKIEAPHVHKVVNDDAVKATPKKDGKLAGSHCSTCGQIILKQKTIYKASEIKLSRKTYKYNGKQKNPKVIVRNSKGKRIAKKNYDVTYEAGRTEVGKYKVTVTFKGDRYEGKKTLTFKIKEPKSTDKT